ncbi:hypothetical protein CNECB9_320014 [Cupriavidus necator]|uniref:Uncharacterized protein n=1 Tax=Cupriavidus necator TaxID=106590 RepID=A0A1K0JEW1_CUPNE|nr:hypothetical protein CNECB9_320014 [Cupriavidus necator]
MPESGELAEEVLQLTEVQTWMMGVGGIGANRWDCEC